MLAVKKIQKVIYKIFIVDVSNCIAHDDSKLGNISQAPNCPTSVEEKKMTSSDNLTSPSSSKSQNVFPCESCGKVYGTRAGLYKHKRIYHPDDIMKFIACIEPDCKCAFKMLQKYREHLQSVHGFQMEIFTKMFNDQKGNTLYNSPFSYFIMVLC